MLAALAYQVIMWSTGAPVNPTAWTARLKELGFTAEQCSGCSPQPDFGFYLENLVSELGFLNSRQSIYQNDWNNYTKAPHDKQWLVRKPSLSDPAFWDGLRPRVEAQVRPYIAQKPLLYQLRDELSIGSFASPMDYDFDPRALASFRAWLSDRYGSLEALNAEWETQFGSWDEVQPFTTYEIKDRERAALAGGQPENYAPWADHREFMDWTFAQSLDRLRGWLKEIDPVTPVGIEGTQMPSAWGGFDLWRLSQAIDWVEPYDICGSREVWRSFLPEGTPVLSTVFGSDFDHIRQRLWTLLLDGDTGAVVWDDDQSRSIRKDVESMPVTDRGAGLAGIFAEIRAGAPRIFGMKRLDDRIAIHYSQASIRAHWMFDSREDKDTWPRRFSSYEATNSRLARVRDSFMRVLEDLGLSYNFVSYEQIERGDLVNGGYKVLLLPQSVAMSAEEVRRIEEFVRAGGTVIADNMTATMDEHCRRLARGQLDDLFGIERKNLGWRSKPGGGALGEFQVWEPDEPVLATKQTGDGHSVYLNIGMQDYGRLRLALEGAAYRDLFLQLLADAGVTPAVRVVDAETGEPVPCARVWRFDSAVAVMRNPEARAADLKLDNSRIEVPARLRIVAGHWAVEADLDPWRPVIVPVE